MFPNRQPETSAPPKKRPAHYKPSNSGAEGVKKGPGRVDYKKQCADQVARWIVRFGERLPPDLKGEPVPPLASSVGGALVVSSVAAPSAQQPAAAQVQPSAVGGGLRPPVVVATQ
jgi:hypothetical protein